MIARILILAAMAASVVLAEDALNADQYTRVIGVSGMVARIDSSMFQSNIPQYNMQYSPMGGSAEPLRFAGIIIITPSNGYDSSQGWVGYNYGGPTKAKVLTTNENVNMYYIVDPSLIASVVETNEMDNDNSPQIGRFYDINLVPSTSNSRVTLTVHPYTSKYYGGNGQWVGARQFNKAAWIGDDFEILCSKYAACTNRFTVCAEGNSEVTLCVAIFL